MRPLSLPHGAGPRPLSRALLPEPPPRFLRSPASPPICFQHSSRGALSECKSDHTHPLLRVSPQPDDVPSHSVKARVSQPHLPELVCLVFSLSLLLHQPLYSTNRPNMAQPQGLCTCCFLCLDGSPLRYIHVPPLSSLGSLLRRHLNREALSDLLLPACTEDHTPSMPQGTDIPMLGHPGPGRPWRGCSSQDGQFLETGNHTLASVLFKYKAANLDAIPSTTSFRLPSRGLTHQAALHPS